MAEKEGGKFQSFANHQVSGMGRSTEINSDEIIIWIQPAFPLVKKGGGGGLI